MAYTKKPTRLTLKMQIQKTTKKTKKRGSLTSNMRSKREQPSGFHLLRLHELDLALLSFVESLLGLGAFGLEGLLQFSYSIHCLVAVN